MISVIASILSGIITGLKTPFLSPALYLLKSRRSVFLLAFFAYCLSLGLEFKILSVYSININFFVVVLPLLLLLDIGLKGEVKSRLDYILIPFLFLGIVFKEIFVVGMSVAIIRNFMEDNPRKGAFAVIGCIAILVTGLALAKDVLSILGAVSTQVVVIASITTLILVFVILKTKVEKLDLI